MVMGFRVGLRITEAMLLTGLPAGAWSQAASEASGADGCAVLEYPMLLAKQLP